MPPSQAPPVVIAAGDEAPFGFVGELGAHIPADALARINAGDLQLRITGTLKYFDIFKRPHLVKFEGAWLPQRSAFGVEKYDTD